MGVGFVRKHVSMASKSCYKLASTYPLPVLTVLALVWFKLWFPVLFSMLMHASPVIASTLAILGTLLFYGNEGKENLHEVHNMETRGLEESYFVKNMNMNMKDDYKLGNWIDNCQKLKLEPKSLLGNQFEDNKLKSGDRSRRYAVDEDEKGWETGSGSDISASMAEINSMLDELNPLSGSEVPFPHVSTDATSDHSLESGDFVNEGDDYNDDDDEEDGEDSVVTWTEEDQRNLMKTSEVDRHQYLENLVARKKALRNLRMLAERNMVNLSPDFNFNATHISSVRKNPFDLPYHTHENNLHRVGPTFPKDSFTVPRRKSFDLPHDPSGQRPERVGLTFQKDPFMIPRRKSFDPSGQRPHRVGPTFQTDPFVIPRRKSFDPNGQRPDRAGPTFQTDPFMIPRRKSFDPSGQRPDRAGPTFQADPFMIPRRKSFDPSGQRPDRAGPTFQTDPVMVPRRKSFDLPRDPSGQRPDRMGPTSQSNSVAFKTNPFASTGSHHISGISDSIIQRSQFSEGSGSGTVKPRQVPRRVGRINKVKISGGKTGYEEKASMTPTTPFVDATDDIYDGDDGDEEEEYSSIDSPTGQDLKELQIEDSSAATGNSEGGSPQKPSQVEHGLKSWLPGWKA